MNTPIFFGTLGPETRGCLDIHDHDANRHLCEGTIGVVGEKVEGYDEDDGPPEARWRIGTQVRMRHICPPGGPYPYCTLVASFADVTQQVAHLMEHGSDGWSIHKYVRQYTLHIDWEELSDKPCASFQWKGATLDLTFTCPLCGTHCHVEGEFGYNAACVKCRAGFSVDHYVPCERVA